MGSTGRPLPSAVVNTFNSGSPEEAFRALGVSSDVDAAAAFLHEAAGLDMAVVGEHLGCDHQQALRRAYVKSIHFRGLPLDQGLRKLLAGFRLPGEAQKVDRILHAFAYEWHRQVGVEGPSSEIAAQPGVGDGAAAASSPSATIDTRKTLRISADAAHVLAFALVMLNTDLHSPAIRRTHRRMTVEQFVRNVRGAGPDVSQLPRTLLVKLYRGIAAREITLTGEGFTSGIPHDDICDSARADASPWRRQRLRAPRALVVQLLRSLAPNRAPAIGGAGCVTREGGCGGRAAVEGAGGARATGRGAAGGGGDLGGGVSGYRASASHDNSCSSCESGGAVGSNNVCDDSVCGDSVCGDSVCGDSVCGGSSVGGRSSAPSSRSAALTELAGTHTHEGRRCLGDTATVGFDRAATVSGEVTETCRRFGREVTVSDEVIETCSVAADDLSGFDELWDEDDGPLPRPFPVFEIHPPSEECVATSVVPPIGMPPAPSGSRCGGPSRRHTASKGSAKGAAKGAATAAADLASPQVASHHHDVTSCAVVYSPYSASSRSVAAAAAATATATDTTDTTTDNLPGPIVDTTATTTSSVGIGYRSRLSRARMANRAAGRVAMLSLRLPPEDDAEDEGFSRI